uniref:Disease resistance protein At4g27190-like leucine-rich repeats domain-containing protein n=1 Tax=Oryza punctata TaxID=4537 RepID=A0A0E0JJK7_ORYPU
MCDPLDFSLVPIWFDGITGTADQILEKYLSNTDRPYYQGGQNIYFDGWTGLGTPAILSAVAESARRKKSMYYDIVIHADCSVWESRRTLQRRIAEELNLDATMVLFDKQDEDDDFSGIEKSSQTEIDEVANLIFRTIEGRTCLLIFNNGSYDEIDLSRLGVPVYERRNTMLWTFRGRFRFDPAIRDKVKNAHLFLDMYPGDLSVWTELMHCEAAQVSREICPALITECWLYLLLLHYNNCNFISHDIDAHACNYWVCDGIIAGDSAWEIADRLYHGMRLEYLPTRYNREYRFDEYLENQQGAEHSRWVSVMPKNSDEVKNIQIIPLEATSYFLTFQRSDPPAVLPNHLFSQGSKLRVLRLSWCTFSFASPPFTCCKNLKFILIDGCINKDVDLTGERFHEKKGKQWEFLQSLWVLDIRDTNWDWILSPSKVVLMVELRELYLRATGRSWHDQILLDMSCLSKLQMFRVIDSSTYMKAAVHDSFHFQHMMNLELLDLSGNTTLHILPNLSGASKLKVLILDGCVGLEVVEPNTLPGSLESFSFDGFGPASRWKHSLKMPQKQARPNKYIIQEHTCANISLEGCGELKNVFLRGLPNLKELNLSETRIEALDLEAMQVQQLERLFLLGCENLTRVKWIDPSNPPLKLLCIDTRGKAARTMDGGCQRSHLRTQQEHEAHLSAHVVATDARFLHGFVADGYPPRVAFGRDVPSQHFHLHISATVNDKPVLPRANEKDVSSRDGLILGFPYLDVIDKVFNNDGEDGCSVPHCKHLVPLDCHIEIAEGGSNLEIKQDLVGICSLICNTQSLHLHDNSSISIGNFGVKTNERFINLRWCHVTRCLKMHTVFLCDNRWRSDDSFGNLETLWVSHLLEARCIWSRELRISNRNIMTTPAAFSKLRCIHLHSCPRLRHVLPCSLPTMQSLETIHITYCGELTQIFPKVKSYYQTELATRIEFPRLRRIHLQDLPMLKDICETAMSAPMLETIKLRGCWSIKRLPAIHAGRPLDKPPAVVDCEKGVWDKLEWNGDGMEARRPLFSPRHSRYYKKNLPRGSVLW